MRLHGRRRLKIRDTIVFECQRLAGRLIRGLDNKEEIDLSVFDLAAEIASAPGPAADTDNPGGDVTRADLGDL
jgi:hypothetical protein